MTKKNMKKTSHGSRKFDFNLQPKTKALLKKSTPTQISKAKRAVKREQGSSIWSSFKKSEKFHFRLVQQRKFDRKKKK